MRRAVAIGLTLLALGIAGCGGDDEEEPQATASGEESQPAAGGGYARGAPAEEGGGSEDDEASDDEESGSADSDKPGETLTVGESDFGTILTDGGGFTLYLFDKEEGERSECYGACAEAWPPFTTKGDPVAGEGVDSKLLGTTERDDGSAQVTYRGHPLYYYVDEDEPGEVLCQGVAEFGGLWLVVDPKGNAIQ
jgi:predicted lipoprotein with Yx(FWY)xxD motif